MSNFTSLAYPGQVSIGYIKLISSQGIVVDLFDYLVELNLFEDIFSNFLNGQIMLSDSRNLISKLPIIGNEYLAFRIETPTLGVPIEKIFRVYSISDINTQRDKSTQTYVLKFCSIEAINDNVISIYKPFKGTVSDIVAEVYQNYLESPASILFKNDDIELDNKTQPLFVLPTKNKIKFLNPGWTPAKTLNWLCSKAIPENGDSMDYLFWETSCKGFNFTSIDNIAKQRVIMGDYSYVPPGTVNSADIITKLFLAESFEVINMVDNIENYNKGYFGNTLSTFDVYKKKFIKYEYNHVENYKNFVHTEADDSVPPFTENTLVNEDLYKRFYPLNSKLYSGVRDNFIDKMPEIFGRRISRLNELNNFKINITVPGRTDMYAGSMINFNYPDATVKNESSEPGLDPVLSGIYFVSAIRHKINLRNHTMIMELVKDSIRYKQ
jgi:hypothetical protein